MGGDVGQGGLNQWGRSCHTSAQQGVTARQLRKTPGKASSSRRLSAMLNAFHEDLRLASLAELAVAITWRCHSSMSDKPRQTCRRVA